MAGAAGTPAYLAGQTRAAPVTSPLVSGKCGSKGRYGNGSQVVTRGFVFSCFWPQVCQGSLARDTESRQLFHTEMILKAATVSVEVKLEGAAARKRLRLWPRFPTLEQGIWFQQVFHQPLTGRLRIAPFFA